MSTIEPVPLIDVIVEAPQWDTTSGAEATVRRALSEAAIAIGADFKDRVLAVLLTDDAAIRRLNAQWRGIDKPTNVLSFPPAPNAGERMAAVKSLGDIAIAYETTAREAETEEKPFDHHLAHLAVHGLLHLLGYDHDSEAAATTMEQLERVILARLGVPDPYLTHEKIAPHALQASRS
jgi:probable rRNA maturation factor